MNDAASAERTLDALQARHPRFHRHAYGFVLDALHAVVDGLGKKRHISGRELAESACELAIRRFGPMARTVLEHWGVHSTEDFGEIVFALVEIGVLVKQDEDRLEDFQGLFDFEEVFDRDYPWSAPS